MEFITLNNGVEMPAVGFGVFQIRDPKICEELSSKSQGLHLDLQFMIISGPSRLS